MNAPFRLSSADFTNTATASDIGTLRFDLKSGDIFTFSRRTAQFERRINGKLQFLRVEDKEVIFLDDRQLAFLSATGEALFVAGSVTFGKPRGPLPGRLSLTPEQECSAGRKLDYVEACIRGGLEGDAESRTSWEFKRSKALEPVIARVAVDKDETPPHFTTVLEWFDTWMDLGDIHGKACLVDRNQHKGNRKTPFGHVGEIALERGVWRWLNPEMTKQMAYAKVVMTVNAYKRKLSRHMLPEELDRIVIPSQRTFERRCELVDHYTRDYYKKGPAYAAKMGRTYNRQPLPERPYQDVEVDHCTLDILLVDDESDLVLGRPDLILFRCRATNMVIGYGLGYEAPSYASFVAGLRHAMYPKDMSRFPAVRQPWPCFGRIENLWVDNALHFIGDDIRDGARELKINKPRFRPRSPWLKGGLERFFGFLNTGLVHLLPGTTLSNVIDRRNVDPDTLDRAKIRVSEFEALLTFFICEIANAHVSKGLGLLRGMGDVPLQVWNRKAPESPSGPLPPADLFIALCGEWENRTIQNDGITWDHITYEGPDLISLMNNPKHRNAREHGKGSLYKCHRDPEDLGRIYVVDPYDKDGRILVIPACAAHRAYAEGRHRHPHSLAVAEARRTTKGALDFDSLMRALDRLGEAAAKARGKPERKQVHNRLARFIRNERIARFPSTVRPGPAPDAATTAGHLDPLAAARGRDRNGFVTSGEPPRSVSPLGPPATAPEPDTCSQGAPGRLPTDVDDPDDDLEALKKSKQWSSSDE